MFSKAKDTFLFVLLVIAIVAMTVRALTTKPINYIELINQMNDEIVSLQNKVVAVNDDVNNNVRDILNRISNMDEGSQSRDSKIKDMTSQMNDEIVSLQKKMDSKIKDMTSQIEYINNTLSAPPKK